MKKEKKEVHYSKGMPSAHCGICTHFIPRSEKCHLVEGDIDPEKWCTLFQRKPKSA